MRLIYVIGSSSLIAKELERIFDDGTSRTIFFGRSNPNRLNNFIEYDGIYDEASADKLWHIIENDMASKIKATELLAEIHLVILSGVSSYDWMNSFFVNEYMPAVIGDNFASKIKEAYPRIKSSIMFVCSSGAFQGAKLPYATTKASLIGAMHALAKDYKETTRVNMILPSAFVSGMTSDWDDEKKKKIASDNLNGRLASASDMADAISFGLNNDFINNSIINMTGGTIRI